MIESFDNRKFGLMLKLIEWNVSKSYIKPWFALWIPYLRVKELIMGKILNQKSTNRLFNGAKVMI